MVVSVNRLTKYYPRNAPSETGYGLWRRFFRSSTRFLAVDHISFEVDQGEVFGLLGPNGAGKTTTIKMLCTLLTPDDGSATINGFDIQRDPMAVKRCLGVLLDSPERGFIVKLSGRDNLEFFCSVYGMARAEARRRTGELLDMVGLSDKADDEMQRYSQGMKQKLALARALLPDPPVVILDEPTLGLDPRSSVEVRQFIRERLKAAGKTVLLTTHNMHVVEDICDRVAIIDKGRIVALDTPANITREISKHQTIEIRVENATDSLVERLRRVEGVTDVQVRPPDPGTTETLYTVLSDARSGIVDRLARAALDDTATLCSITRRIPSFEEVFLKVLSR